MKDAQPKAIRLSEYRPPNHVITDTRLEFDLRDGVTQVTSQLSVRAHGNRSRRCGSTVRNSNSNRWRWTDGRSPATSIRSTTMR